MFAVWGIGEEVSGAENRGLKLGVVHVICVLLAGVARWY